MRRTLLLIVYSLVLSLVIQNTCPFGAAGKTGIVRAYGHCGMKHCPLSPGGKKEPLDDAKPDRFPLFAFTIADAKPAFQLELCDCSETTYQVGFHELFPVEILKPPRSFA
jgi:hypothetical protein